MIIEIRITYYGFGAPEIERDYWNDAYPTDVINHSLYNDEGEWQVIEPGGIPVATNNEPYGLYTTIGSTGYEYFASPVCGSPAQGSQNRRRSSLELTYDQQAILEAIAFNVGATWRGEGSWRVMLRRLYQGKLRLTRRRTPINIL